MATKDRGAVYVGGEWIRPDNAPDEVINPATESVFAHAPVGGSREVEQAIGAARDAFDNGPWPRMSPSERAVRMGAFFNALMARKAEILTLLVEEVGSTQTLADALQFSRPMEHARYFVEAGAKVRDVPISLGGAANADGSHDLVGGVVKREPVGVVAAITPYNFPYYLNIMKVFPALVTGNTMIVKPSPFTPFSALIIAEAAAEADLPRGVFSVVTGGKEVGEKLTLDRRVDMITFTGSDTVGALIMAQAASSLKRIHFELGGKSALIVRKDADVAKAARAGLQFTTHCGQGCALLTRHIVHNDVRAEFVSYVKEGLEKLKIGDPADKSVDVGPLIRATQRDRVERFVQSGEASGATLVAGGKRPSALKRGFFYEPTLFDNVDNKSEIAQQEVFGPVAVVIGFDTDEEAVRLANDSDFGLSGSVFSRNLGAAFAIANAVRTGGVNINGGGSAGGAPMPFGGFKRSGIGRENGEEGLNAFTELKSISIRS